MFRHPILVLLVVTGVIAGEPRVAGEPAPDPGSDAPGIERELRRISDTLEILVRLERTNLLLQRAILEDRRLEPLRDEERGLRSEQRALEEERERVEGMIESTRSDLEAARRDNRETQAAALATEVRLMEQAHGDIDKRLDSTTRRLQEVEADLARSRRRLDALLDKLDAFLDE